MNMLHGRLVHVGETVTDLQILGCELHQNESGGRAPPRPAAGDETVKILLWCSPRSAGRSPDSLAVIRVRGRGRKGLGIGKEGR